jgi:hypothetical protein
MLMFTWYSHFRNEKCHDCDSFMIFTDQFYVGKQQEAVVVNEEKRAMDPWIMNLDLGSLLREYALLTGSMADAARQIREPIMKRDDGLLQRGLEKQARLDYLALKELALSELPKKKDGEPGGSSSSAAGSTKKSSPDAPVQPSVPQLNTSSIASIGTLNAFDLLPPPSGSTSLDGSNASMNDVNARPMTSATDMMLNTARTDVSSSLDIIQIQRYLLYNIMMVML